MTHISTNFDRTGFQQDWNVVFPLARLWEGGSPALRHLGSQGFLF
jgi:D-proline reductase (dithiol) PrdB